MCRRRLRLRTHMIFFLCGRRRHRINQAGLARSLLARKSSRQHNQVENAQLLTARRWWVSHLSKRELQLGDDLLSEIRSGVLPLELLAALCDTDDAAVPNRQPRCDAERMTNLEAFWQRLREANVCIVPTSSSMNDLRSSGNIEKAILAGLAVGARSTFLTITWSLALHFEVSNNLQAAGELWSASSAGSAISELLGYRARSRITRPKRECSLLRSLKHTSGGCIPLQMATRMSRWASHAPLGRGALLTAECEPSPPLECRAVTSETPPATSRAVSYRRSAWWQCSLSAISPHCRFCALLHAHDPKLLSYERVSRAADPEARLHLAFSLLHRRLGVPWLLDTEPVASEACDLRSIVMYTAKVCGCSSSC